jgi:C-terminal processing protease CtpA/Prc
MKKYFLPAFLFLSNIGFAQKNETQKIATFCKVWGFLKYYHPEAAKGKLDWDSVFRSRLQILYTLKNKEAIHNFYSGWIQSLGIVPACKKCDYKPAVTFNYDNGWINDEKNFGSDVSRQLQWIEANRNSDTNFYVQQYKDVPNTKYVNEKPYADSVFPSAELRLLGLARFWNIIQYYFPYKYVIGRDWKEVLIEMVPKFQFAKDTVEYHLAMKELVASINDSHAQFNTDYTSKWAGYKWVPFGFRLIDNKAVAVEFLNDSLCRENDIRIGDVFLTVEGRNIADIIKEKWKYISASNDAVKLRGMSYAIFNGATDSVMVTFERDGMIKEKIIRRYLYKDFHYTYYNGGPDSFRIINGNIGYVNLGWLKPERVNEVMKAFRKTTSIIFDVRNYPNSTLYQLSWQLNSRKTPFVKFTAPDLSYPGYYSYTKIQNIGGRNNDHYKGKVILLFNEYSQSHAEFTLMALKTAPNVIGIGSQTAGADGNVSTIIFPGNYKTYMTGIGVYYPDGTETQRIGIAPDIVVKPTIAGIKAGKDEVLERAIIEASK